VLSDNGRTDLAYALASQTTYPSWGYMLENGATTIWELWNANTVELENPDNSADPGMNSRNHIMLVGDLITWLYEYLAGIKPDATQPGFKHILMRCEPVRGLSYVRASHRSPYGLIRSEWKKDSDANAFHWTISVPVNTTATIFMPGDNPRTVTESGKPIVRGGNVKFLRQEKGRSVFFVGSGTYHFASEIEW